MGTILGFTIAETGITVIPAGTYINLGEGHWQKIPSSPDSEGILQVESPQSDEQDREPQ